MKQTISWFLVFMIVFSCASLLRGLGPAKEEPWENPYVDVTQDLWSYQYITELNKAGVLPSSEKFQGEQLETRVTWSSTFITWTTASSKTARSSGRKTGS